MDRLNQIRGDAGDSRDSTLDSSSPPSEAFLSVNESPTKFYSFSEVDSTFSISPLKDTTASVDDSDRTITGDAEIISTLSPIPKSDIDTYKIGKHIEAANILSGGVNIFDDNDNSYDGDELVIDDNVTLEDDKTNIELKLTERAVAPLEKTDEVLPESVDDAEAIPSKDTEVVLQIDGKNVDAIDIGNGLYLYRKAGEEELAAVQMIEDDQQQPSFKFLKVRENTEGNLEVYEEIEVEIPKEVPTNDGSGTDKIAHVPIKDINKVINEPCNKVIDKAIKTPKIETNLTCMLTSEPSNDILSESKSEVNLNGKMMKFNESRKSPLIGTFTPMTYHSTPNKEGIPLTKTMVNQQLHPSRHSDNIKKTIEVHTDSSKPKVIENSVKSKEFNEGTKMQEIEKVIPETDECKNQMIACEDNQKVVKTVNKISIEEAKCIMSEQNESTKDYKELKSFCEHDKCESKTPEDSKVNTEHKVLCKELKFEDKELKDSNINKEIIDTNGDLAVIIQKETSGINKESAQYQEKQEVNKSKSMETIDNEHNGYSKSSGNINLNTTENKNIDCNKNEPIDNLVTIDDSVTNVKKVALTADLVSKEKIDIGGEFQSHKKDDPTQLMYPAVDEFVCSQPSPTAEIKTNTENAGILKNIQENDSLVITCTKNITSMPTFDDSKNNIVNKVGKSEETCGSGKVGLENTNVYNINKDTLNGSNKPKPYISSNKTVTPECDLQVATTLMKSSSDIQTEKDIYNKYIKEKVEESKADTKDTLSVEPAQMQVLESQTTSKADVDTAKSISKDKVVIQTKLLNNQHTETKKEVPNSKITLTKANCNNAVPFGKWTEAHRQEFLNKIKETKVPSSNSNTNQIKQTNDLNRRDVLKKFDSQRQSTVTVPAKVSDFGSVPKFSSKMDTDTAAFVNKSVVIQQTNPLKPLVPSLKTQTVQVKHKPNITKKDVKEETIDAETLVQRRIINSQELIDKTVEGIIIRSIKIKTIPDHMKEQKTIHTVENPKDAMPLPGSLDDIEMKMNELHGISFTDRPIQELSQPYKPDAKTFNKTENVNINKNVTVPKLLPFKVLKDQLKPVRATSRDDISDEEIIEHEPITGDIDVGKQNLISLLSGKEKTFIEPKKDAIITEKDFDKFARRNSITYENRLTVNFDSKEQHNVVQTIVEKEPSAKKLSRNELLLAESKAKSSNKQNTAPRNHTQISKIPTLKPTSEEDSYNKNYQSKVQIAYHSALTAKRNLEGPITIIEDKPVKVVYMDTEFSPTLLNVQGQELSPSKNKNNDTDIFEHSASESLDSDILDSSQDSKSQDEIKFKSKHQRKQVLTPVKEELEIQLIEPADLGIKVSPTKKRRIEEKVNKNSKTLPKKSYLLNRSVVDEHAPKTDQQNIFKETENRKENFMGHTDTKTAIDNLVKAAELIETQFENNSNNVLASQATDISQNTPVKRGRGRPRKYPIEPGADINKSLSSQKKPRLIDAKIRKPYTDSDESSDGEIVKENWTMGKINENIVCPICNKLFRSENVVFKHVKHCTGPSPNRSDCDKRSPRRLRNSQESDEKLRDSGSDDTDSEEEERVRSRRSNYDVSKSVNSNDDVIIIEDAPIKENHSEETNNRLEPKKIQRKTKLQHNTNNLMCEFCGKTFRQLSYLVNHKMQHKNEDNTKLDSEDVTKKSVFSCEVCKKEFRKLHHLVQHRIIHNPNSMASRVLRKSSSEQQENKKSKTQKDDAGAGFRCEPCDKSFRKLHHLVEHRETHDGINKKGNTNTTQWSTESSKSVLAHPCDICKKVFKKLEDLLEHKEQHYETSSEKSDDKSVKSSLSTKDIIHECSLCYMVFPNEHSLNKHTVICLRKKKQSAAKQAAKQAEGKDGINANNLKSDEEMPQDVEPIEKHEIEDSDETDKHQEVLIDNTKLDEVEEKLELIGNEPAKGQMQETKHNLEVKSNNQQPMPKKRRSSGSEKLFATDDIEIPSKIKKTEDKEHVINLVTPTPKKKCINKEKIAPTVTKRHKTLNVPLPVVEDIKPSVESSDDDEVRYMLNPNFKQEESIESKLFMEIRALKRNSLQIERPNSKDLVKRRISLQHPPKMPRLKAKAVEARPTGISTEKTLKPSATESYTDSDDSDVKYSFPEKSHMKVTPKIADKKIKRQSMKRKSLTDLAKRKSLGKLVSSTVKPKKRTEAEHRCDCGQLFSSAALLSRHTTLAHTPPRIRRRRSPPPDTGTQQNTKPQNTKPPNTKLPTTKPPTTKIPINKSKPIAKTAISKPINKIKTDTQQTKNKRDVTVSNKKIVKVGVTTRKSSETNAFSDVGKSVKSESNFKSLRSAMRASVIDKMRKPADKSKK